MFRIDVDVKVSEFGPIVRDSVKLMANNIREKGRRSMMAGGHFGQRFTRGLTTSVRQIEGGYRVRVLLKPAFAKVFEYGGESVGKPLLWMGVPGTPAYGKRAKTFGGLIRPRTPGIFGTRVGARYRNVLINRRTGQVMFVGVPRTRNVQRFHIRDIAYAEAENFLKTMGQTAGVPK